MGFVERIFSGIGKAVTRALTPPGTGDQTQAAPPPEAPKPAPPPTPIPPTAPAPPPPAPEFRAGMAPGSTPRAKVTASTMLGAAAAGSSIAKGGLGGGSSTKKSVLG